MSKPAVSRRHGVTLIELMVICAILGVLMGMVLFALQGAMEQARADRTRAQVVKINDLIMERWEAYRQRPMPMRKTYGANTAANVTASDRLYSTWELMRMELPERFSDLSQPAVYLKSPSNAPLQPALWRAYRKKAEALTGGSFVWANMAENTGGPDIATKWTGEYMNAECLYLILSTIRDGETNGLDFFTPSEIGDIDGDGMPEILDGWRRPIRFLRWAPGYCGTSNGTSVVLAAPTNVQTGDAANQHDPFDPLKMFPSHYAVFPLVYSAGPDAGYGIRGDKSGDPSDVLIYGNPMAPPQEWNNPYLSNAWTPGPAIGGCVQENGKDTYIDNITNHITVTR